MKKNKKNENEKYIVVRVHVNSITVIDVFDNDNDAHGRLVYEGRRNTAGTIATYYGSILNGQVKGEVTEIYNPWLYNLMHKKK